MRVSTATRWVEGFGAGALVGLLSLLFPADPAFRALGFLPQAFAPVITASLLGAVPGAFAFLGATLATLALPLLAGLLGLSGFDAVGFQGARIPAALSLLCALAAGALRDSYSRSTKRILLRFRDLTRSNVQLRKMNLALSGLTEELERRVSGQRDSVSSLYARIRKMDSLDMDRVLSGFLDAVVAFSQASSAAVFEYDHEAKRLVCVASLVKGAVAPPQAEEALDLEGSIEGWVFRNDSPFSLRNVDDYLNLAGVDFKRSVLSYPLRAGDLPWGVLNVREMPFYRYNPVTEKNLGIVVELASSYIKKAADFRDRVLSHPRNAITGLPGYGELLRILEGELDRRASRRLSVSVVIVELIGFEEMAFAHSGLKAFGLLKDFAETAVSAAGGRAIACHYRVDGQLAFLLPDIDRDGASLFCLSLSGLGSDGLMRIDGEKACVEIAFGLAAFPGQAGAAAAAGDAEALLAEAESVLTLSKRAYTEHGGSCP